MSVVNVKSQLQPMPGGFVEPVLESGNVMHFYLLGPDGVTLKLRKAEPLRADIRPRNSATALPLLLEPDKESQGSVGMVSAFFARVPAGVRGPFELSVNLPADDATPGCRLRFQLGEASPLPSDERQPHVDSPMPSTAASAQVQARLYSAPGGAYKLSDMEANGRTAPIYRFQDIPIRHDFHPLAGDFICPVTRTKANPRVVWTVSGRQYLFCCPSCIDEFVRRAKTDPRNLKPPTEYVAR